jgi:hypothetical protein
MYKSNKRFHQPVDELFERKSQLNDVRRSQHVSNDVEQQTSSQRRARIDEQQRTSSPDRSSSRDSLEPILTSANELTHEYVNDSTAHLHSQSAIDFSS